SIDPAHSLADSFDCSIGPTRTQIEGRPNLSALELEPGKLLVELKERNDRQIRTLVDRGGILKQVDMKEILSLSLPGMEQTMTFVEIVKMLKPTWPRPSQADLIILDTPPSGHALRLLLLPESASRWVDSFDVALRHYHKFHPAKYDMMGQPRDLTDQFVQSLRRGLEAASALMKNAKECEFVPVMIPESLSISETEDLLASLEGLGIPVSSIIVNKIEGDGECDFCSSRANAQAESIAGIGECFPRYNLVCLPLCPHEVRGIDDLTDLGETLSGGACEYPSYQPNMPSFNASTFARANISEILERDLRFITFNGKGGVGKTTIAAATALGFAKRYTDRKVLVYSLDPAHSLADSFDCPVGDRVVNIPGSENLYAAEVDPVKLQEQFLDEYKAIIVDAFDTWEERMRGSTLELRLDRNTMVTFAKTSPPALGELLALENLTELAESERYDLCVLDTAPTGHLLELLEFPQLVRDWLSKAYRGLIKYHIDRPLPNLQALGDKMMKSVIAIRDIRQALTDPQKSALVVVTIAESMAIEETKRLLASLAELEIPSRHVIFNMMVPPSECIACSSRRMEQKGYVQQLVDWNSSNLLFGEVPLFPREIKGIDNLAELSALLYE
ncbi:MAG: ArsA family ATPase, partial [Dehalococcoidia bacterium]